MDGLCPGGTLFLFLRYFFKDNEIAKFCRGGSQIRQGRRLQSVHVWVQIPPSASCSGRGWTRKHVIALLIVLMLADAPRRRLCLHRLLLNLLQLPQLFLCRRRSQRLSNLCGFDTTPGPGLSVVLHSGDVQNGFVVGSLISASGNYPYPPYDLDVGRYTTVAIYKKKYNVIYGEADLK